MNKANDWQMGGPLYTGPTVRNHWVPIPKISASWKVGFTELIRKQFPLQLAYDVTIHKSQRLTLEKAVINIGATELNIGMSYVAISRVKTLKGLAFENGFDFERISNFRNRQLFVERQNCEEQMLEGNLENLFRIEEKKFLYILL